MADAERFAPLPWQRRPRTHLMLVTTSILCIVAMYTALSSTERSSVDLEDAIRRTSDVCLRMEQAENSAALRLSHLRVVPPTTPPAMHIHVHLVLCPAVAEDSSDIHSIVDDALTNALHDTLAVIRGLLHQAASNGKGRGAVNMVTDVPTMSLTLSKSPARICKPKSAKQALASSSDDSDDDALTAEEAASVGALVVDATTQSWIVLATIRDASHESDLDQNGNCQRDHNRRMWCNLILPAPNVDSGNVTAPAMSERVVVRQWLGGVVGSILGVDNFRDVAGIRGYLARRRYAACRYVESALGGLVTVLEAAPTMPLGVALGAEIEQSVRVIEHSLDSSRTSRGGVVRAAEAVERCTLDPTLLPQMFFPLDHLLAVHLSFLLPMIVAFLAGLGLTLKEWKRMRKGAHKGTAVVATPDTAAAHAVAS